MNLWKRWQSRLKAVKEDVLPPAEPVTQRAEFDQEARILVRAARGDAEVDGMKVSAPYILMALLRGEYADCQALFQELGVDTEALQEYVIAFITNRANAQSAAGEQSSSDPNAIRTDILGCAERTARSMGLKRVTPLHILFGLVADERAWSAPVLTDLGVNLQVVRARLVKVYGHLLVQPSAAPEDIASLLHVVLTTETESKDLLLPSSEEV